MERYIIFWEVRFVPFSAVWMLAEITICLERELSSTHLVYIRYPSPSCQSNAFLLDLAIFREQGGLKQV